MSQSQQALLRGIIARRWLVQGHVQGVGFRPCLGRWANELHLVGWVRNELNGVIVHVQGPSEQVHWFEHRLHHSCPLPIQVNHITLLSTTTEPLHAFCIQESQTSASTVAARIPADLGICQDCVAELRDPKARRFCYAFTACTRCGPRYSLLEAMPFDRTRTEMRPFPLCRDCLNEYDCYEDRHCHAQTLACPACGPTIRFLDANGLEIASSVSAMRVVQEFLEAGRIVALQGMSGFHLLVRADLDHGIQQLRQRKLRPSKALAVMLPRTSAEAVLKQLEPEVKKLLLASENPIVLIDRQSIIDASQQAEFKQTIQLSDLVAPGLQRIGWLLPGTSVHRLLMDTLPFPVVCTSGNRSDEPIALHASDAVQRLQGIADGYLIQTRKITRSLDDSVFQVIQGNPSAIRIGRGWAPMPLVHLEKWANLHQLPPMLALGGDQKVSLAFWTGQQAVLSQHLGDMSHPLARERLEATIVDWCQLYRCEYKYLIHDLHPDYFTTQWAAKQNTARVEVQHHHAHALACLAEHGRWQERVLALAWDGTGWGVDGTFWGSEALIVHGLTYERFASLQPFALPGGESAIRQPARVLVAMLEDETIQNHKPLHKSALREMRLNDDDVSFWATMTQRGINAPLSTSMGRLFDVAAMMILEQYEPSYEGELPALLEALATSVENGRYSLHLHRNHAHNKTHGQASWLGRWAPLIHQLLLDKKADMSLTKMANHFHAAIVSWAVEIARLVPDLPIVLTGGCFQNRYLTELLVEQLSAEGREVLLHRTVPPNDGGLSAGQLLAGMLHWGAQRA